MNDRGFIFTTDAVLMLIPIFILITALAGFSLHSPPVSNYYIAHDAMDSIATQDDYQGNLKTLAYNISNGNKTVPNNITRILTSFNGWNYNLTYYNSTTGQFQTLSNKSVMTTNISIISTAVRVYGNMTFKLYMWR